MLDRYIWGDVDRVSPEAPVPVVHHQRKSARAGGAANVALNLAGLGVETSLIGCVGNDGAAKNLSTLLDEEGIQTQHLIEVADRPTTTKTRIVGNRQQMLRLDDEYVRAIDEETIDRLLEAVSNTLGEVDVTILSDYAKGVLTASVCKEIIERASRQECPVLADPKGTDYDKYAGANTITPNDRELSRVTGITADNVDELLKAGQDLRSDLEIRNLIVTRGEQGISRLSDAGREHYTAVEQEVFDVSGAGDTVVATLAAGNAVGLERDVSIRLANLAASIVIGKVGTTPIKREALADAVRHRRLSQTGNTYSRDRIQKQVHAWRSQSKTIVFTNGCFDILHVGHVSYLEKAKEEGDCLVVGLNTDRSVRALKGDPRPIVPEEQRARVLASLESVDAVVPFDEETPETLIEEVHPDVLVKGADYDKSEVVGAEAVEEWGGRVELIPLVDGVSTTKILRRVRKAKSE